VRPITAAYALALLVGVAAVAARGDDEKPPPDLAPADALFKAGKFAEAEKAYARVVAGDPRNLRATGRLGYIALLSNRLDEAQRWLEKAVALKPDEAPAKALLAEAFYRRDDFAKAAPLLRDAGQEAEAAKLESFKGVTPYQISGEAESTSLKFVVTDPLPLVRVRVNGGEEVNFLIDTGAAEVVLDTEFAKEVGVKTFGSRTGTFAGGKRADVQQGRVDALALGAFTVKNLPVGVLPTRRFSGPIFGGRRVDGILGTVLFYHFLATLDYPNGELVLRRNTDAARKRLEEEAKAGKSSAVPFWMAGDHFMVAWGRVEQSDPVLLFVDTGLAGGGVTLAESTLKEAGIKLAEDQAGEGIGGGGRVKVTPFRVKELSLGDVKEQNVRGLFSGAFPLENRLGFRIGGIISHGFFRPYALTFDFTGMRLLLRRPG
jgi:predicted aspartyl protease